MADEMKQEQGSAAGLPPLTSARKYGRQAAKIVATRQWPEANLEHALKELLERRDQLRSLCAAARLAPTEPVQERCIHCGQTQANHDPDGVCFWREYDPGPERFTAPTQPTETAVTLTLEARQKRERLIHPSLLAPAKFSEHAAFLEDESSITAGDATRDLAADALEAAFNQVNSAVSVINTCRTLRGESAVYLAEKPGEESRQPAESAATEAKTVEVQATKEDIAATRNSGQATIFLMACNLPAAMRDLRTARQQLEEARRERDEAQVACSMAREAHGEEQRARLAWVENAETAERELTRISGLLDDATAALERANQYTLEAVAERDAVKQRWEESSYAANLKNALLRENKAWAERDQAKARAEGLKKALREAAFSFKLFGAPYQAERVESALAQASERHAAEKAEGSEG